MRRGNQEVLTFTVEIGIERWRWSITWLPDSLLSVDMYLVYQILLLLKFHLYRKMGTLGR